MKIKAKIYTDQQNLSRAHEAVDIVNEYVNGNDIVYPWRLFKFETEVKVLGVDFIETDMLSLFPDFNEYPRITLSQNDELAKYSSKFTLDTLGSALRNLHASI